jgi:hypothetical protein
MALMPSSPVPVTVPVTVIDSDPVPNFSPRMPSLPVTAVAETVRSPSP